MTGPKELFFEKKTKGRNGASWSYTKTVVGPEMSQVIGNYHEHK